MTGSKNKIRYHKKQGKKLLALLYCTAKAYVHKAQISSKGLFLTDMSGKPAR